MKHNLITQTAKEAWPLLPSGQFIMEISNAEVCENTLAQVNKDGSLPLQLVIDWVLAESRPDVDDTCVVRQYIPFYYGMRKAGGPTQLKELLDRLAAQNAFVFNPSEFDPMDLVGIKQSVLVSQYTKRMGKNAGQLGHKVISVYALPAEKQREERFLSGTLLKGKASQDGNMVEFTVDCGNSGTYVCTAQRSSAVVRLLKARIGTEVSLRVYEDTNEIITLEDDEDLPF